MTVETSGNDMLRLAAAIVTSADGRFLTVRKRNTGFLLQPGGKIEPGETSEHAVRREVHEELGVIALGVRFVASLSAPAANEPGVSVSADVYVVDVGEQEPVASAEIAELIWIDPAGARESPPLPYPLAALTHLILSELEPK